MGAQVYFNMMETLHCSVPPPVKIGHRHSATKTKLTRTKRNLFGAVKSDEVKQIYVAQMQLQEEEKKQKWNFDFRHGIPLNGTMQWEQVNRVPVVPIWSTQAAHVLTVANSSGVKRTSSISSEDCLSSEELLDERAERANRDFGGDVESHDESQSSNPSTLPLEQVKEAILPSPPQRTGSPKPSSSKGSKMRQPQITEFMKERKRRLSSNVPVEKISAKKVRMMLANPENGVGQQQQQQQQEEVATSSAN
ncbi:cyclin-dependent kinase inhibitor 1B [Anopheles moucheti]|uniref:cyclin-dependent kinase inhibitor 1B n=1 Tax=Anopheles moucheti TaxID=186751 RepID=UPI0022F03157|nr:cyclin-dependent kinase inhibitor 1B [Anopheles moucheti]